MNVLPVIERELRTTARQGATYWLRVGGAAAALVAVAMFASEALLGSIQGYGALVFATVHRVVFFSIWLGVPWLVGDCISRERREGTLGLLFLTPLKPSEIVLAKVLVHGLRALSMWLAVLPVMSLAFLLGGVGWREALMSVAINFSALCTAMGAGLIATSLSRQWLRAMALATCLSLAMLCMFLSAWGTAAALFQWRFIPGAWMVPGPVGGGFTPMRLQVYGGGWAPGIPGMGLPSVMVTKAVVADLLLKSATQIGLSMCWLGCMILVAAGQMRRVWQEGPPPAWLQELDRVFCQPRYWKGTFRRWMRWQVERNPIGWLEQRTWTGRLIVWSWFAVVVSIYSAVFASPQMFINGFDEVQMFLNGAMLLFLCTSAAGSFRRERETGVLELLLISPISEQRIIGGRLRGLWGKFLPALVLMTFVWISFPSWMGNPVAWAKVFFVLAAFGALPVIGLYQSLRRRSFLGALIATLGWGLVVPFLAPQLALLPLRLVGDVLTYGRGGHYWAAAEMLRFTDARLVTAALAQLMLALGFGALLHRNLVSRKFALEHTAGG